jgi:ribose transport system permease protein
MMGLDASYMQLIRGGLLLLAVMLDSLKSQIRRRWL